MKILISWYAKNNDFDQQQQVRADGPTMAFHQYFFNDYDEHILLSTREENDGDPFLDKLEREIKQKYKTLQQLEPTTYYNLIVKMTLG